MALLILGILNFVFSFALKDSFEKFRDLPSTCEVAGAATLATYSLFLVLGSGCFVLTIYVSAFLYKILHLLALLICPNFMVCIKKTYHKKPKTFASYHGEFEFTIDLSKDPECHDGVTPDQAEYDSCRLDHSERDLIN